MNNPNTLGSYIPNPANRIDAAPDIKLPSHLKALVYYLAEKNNCTPEQQLEDMVRDSHKRTTSAELLALIPGKSHD